MLAQISSALFLLVLFSPLPPPSESGLKSLLGTDFAEGGLNEGLRCCREAFHISLFMLRGMVKCKSLGGLGRGENRN